MHEKRGKCHRNTTVWSLGSGRSKGAMAGFRNFAPMAARWLGGGVFGNYIGVGFSRFPRGAGKWSSGRVSAMVSLSFASLSREGGLVVATLGYGVNWAVFLSGQPELGDHEC